MTLVEQLKASGYRAVKTYGGIVSLDEWRPYGKTPEELRHVALYEKDGIVCERSIPPLGERPFMTGQWELVR